MRPHIPQSFGGANMAGTEEVRRFWEAHVNNEYYTEQQRGSQQYFDEITAKRYNLHYHLSALFRQIGDGNGKALLEIGCGIGIDTVSLARLGFAVTAIDLSETAVAVAENRARDMGLSIAYEVGNCEQLRFADNTFDIVYSFGVIHHTPDIRQAIREIHRVLKPNGTAHVMIYHRYSLVNLAHVLTRTPYESPKNLRDHCPVVIRSSRKEARRLFDAFSTTLIRTEYPFTYGMRHVARFIPMPLQRMLGRCIGWHLMIKAVK